MLLAQFSEPELSILFTGLLTTWLFAVGACVGSFLNVVVYRTPAGLSIAHPPSHCPHCQQQIVKFGYSILAQQFANLHDLH